GWWWKGRGEIEQKLTAAYAFVFRDSVLTITDVDVRLLTPSVAIAHVRWTMTGARTPQGYVKVQEGIQTQTLTKSDGKWLIAAFQNTTAIPEAPFPQGAASVRATTRCFAVSRNRGGRAGRKSEASCCTSRLSI